MSTAGWSVRFSPDRTIRVPLQWALRGPPVGGFWPSMAERLQRILDFGALDGLLSPKPGRAAVQFGSPAGHEPRAALRASVRHTNGTALNVNHYYKGICVHCWRVFSRTESNHDHFIGGRPAGKHRG